MSTVLMNLIESHLPSYKDLGYEYVVVFRHRDDPDLIFVEPYKNYYESTVQRKYWTTHNYVVKKFYDLDYGDWLREQE